MLKKRDILKERRQKGFVGKIIIFLVLMCIIAAMTEIRLHPKRHYSENVTEIPFQY